MSKTLLDGQKTPEDGDSISVRLLRGREGDVVVDRPYKENPLKISVVGDELHLPEDPGTYEIRGTVSTFALAAGKGPDYLVLRDQELIQVSESIVELDTEQSGGPEGTEAVGLDISPDMIPSETTEAQENNSPNDRAGLSSDGDLETRFNELLIG